MKRWRNPINFKGGWQICLDYNAERYCPVYNEIIGDGLCYDTIMCMTKQIKVSSLPELNNVKDIQKGSGGLRKMSIQWFVINIIGYNNSPEGLKTWKYR